MKRAPMYTEDGPDAAVYKDLSLPEIFNMFPDGQTAMQWLEGSVWSDGPAYATPQNFLFWASVRSRGPFSRLV